MPSADLILRNANVLTIDPKQPTAELVAVKSGRILFVGASDHLSEFQGIGTKTIDCEGRTITPGFNDTHCHIFSNIRKLLSVDLNVPEITTIADVKHAIKQQAERTPVGEWINATGYNEFNLLEKRHPTCWELDEVSPVNPVVLSHRSLHACVLNSRGLELAKINNDTPEPPGGFIARDMQTGAPNGLLIEMLAYIREKILPPISNTELDKGIRLANAQYLSLGLTSLGEATYVNDLERWQRYRLFKETGLLKSRIYMMCGPGTIKEFQNAEIGFRTGNDDLRLGAMKIVPSLISDALHPPRDELIRQILTAHRAGFQVAIHAVQNKLIEAVITAFEDVKQQCPDFNLKRHRLEHCAECTPELQRRLKHLDLLVTTHPSFTYYNGDRYLDTVAPELIPHLYPLKALLENGLRIAAASDSPVVNPNPLWGIYSGVNRITASGKRISPEQALRPNQLLSLYTLNSAYHSFDELVKGSITPGKLADFVLLSDNPLTTSPETIKDIRVEMTVIGGEIVWQR